MQQGPTERSDGTEAGRGLASLAAGLLFAFVILVVELFLARQLDFVPLGTRAQATGACLASLVLVLSGLVLGIRAERKTIAKAAMDAVRAPSSTSTAERIAAVERELVLLLERGTESMPWSSLGLIVLVLAIAGALGLYTGLGRVILPAETLGTGGIARAIFATDAIVLPAAMLLAIGALLGLHTRPWTLITALAGYAALAVLAGGAAYGASYDPAVVRSWSLAGLAWRRASACPGRGGGWPSSGSS